MVMPRRSTTGENIREAVKPFQASLSAKRVMKVIIPLQLASTRIAEKNIKPFFNQESLFDIKARQLAKVVAPSQIYVSSESPVVERLVEPYGFNFLARPAYLTGNTITQPELIGYILEQMPADDDDIMWVQVTQPLFDRFEQMIQKWAEVRSRHDSIAAVKTLKKHVIAENGIPMNFNFGCWHKVSQQLPVFYELLWACFIIKRSAINQTRYHLGISPYYLPFDDIPLVDIDTEMDFIIAAKLYELWLKADHV